MNKLKILILSIVSFFLFTSIWNAAINFTVSPIKYEIDAFTWTTISKTALLRNNSNQAVTILTTASDFQSNWATWKPQFVRYSELVHPDQQLSKWINIDTNSFVINPNENKTINFSINVPGDTTPGWHYWAVCFKNDKSENPSNNGTININVDYCILLLVNVDWEIISKANVKDTVISLWWWGSSKSLSKMKKDDCLIDLTSSPYDQKCIDNFFGKDDDFKNSIDKLNLDENSSLTPDDFVIDFSTVIKNDWNSHINPTWKIVLVDVNQKELKWIWKETIKNEDWAIIWEKIVDYLPFNDEWWNVLPSQDREYIAEWKWFPYEWYDENWKKVIKYWTPEEYYTMKNKSEIWYIMPWQRENLRINQEKIKANINISYINADWENVEFNSAKEFDIYYKEKYIWNNPYVFICFGLFIFVIYILWLIFRKKKYKCVNCKKKLEEDMIVCPYCWIRQDDKRYRKNRKKKKYYDEDIEDINEEQELEMKDKHEEEELYLKNIHDEEEKELRDKHKEKEKKLKDKHKEKNSKNKHKD